MLDINSIEMHLERCRPYVTAVVNSADRPKGPLVGTASRVGGAAEAHITAGAKSRVVWLWLTLVSRRSTTALRQRCAERAGVDRVAVAHSWQFDAFELIPGNRTLLLNRQPVAVGARAFDVLQALIERRDRLVSKKELLDVVWTGVVVEENNLQVQISALRKLLGPQAIATVPGRVIASLDRSPSTRGTPRRPPRRRRPPDRPLSTLPGRPTFRPFCPCCSDATRMCGP
jgi:hypothetical protein